jgi:bidirectional [NiFe] hydrogenase diaphorase subunit
VLPNVAGEKIFDFEKLLTNRCGKEAMADIMLEINGKKVSANKGETILEAARSNGIEIPTLCYLKGLAPHGGCRLCLVELKQGKRSQLVASCGYYVKDDLVVETESPRVQKVRKLLLELLIASMPDSEEIHYWAEKYGVHSTRFDRPPDYCILCGLCVRYCDEMKQGNCLGFVGRGVHREVAWVPLATYTEKCVKCMEECQKLCPTGVFPSNWGIAGLHCGDICEEVFERAK